ncbi:hypothetical protein JCM1840_002489 [Sporobolomyces johnsonii]
MAPYAYPEPNSTLISSLALQPHPEGGYYAETVRTKETTPSPFADGAERSLATEIYYLLTPDSARGRMHMNKSITFHLHHQGRALYTLVKPTPPGSSEAPQIKRVVMGTDSAKGEVRQLLVEGGWWKASEIPDEDLAGVENEKDARIGCLISEVVVPGFHWQDHAFLTEQGLVDLFHGDASSEGVKQLLPYVKREEKN